MRRCTGVYGYVKGGSVSTILLADDLAIVRDPIAFVLERAGHVVLIADDGNTAWKLIEGHGPDLLILDIGMPGRSGLEVLELVRADGRFKTTPAIMLTDANDAETVKRAVDAGAQDYLLKSTYTTDGLLSRVNRHLGGGDGAGVAAPAGDSVGAKAANAPASRASTTQQAEDDAVPARNEPLALSVEDREDAVRAMKPKVSRREVAELLDNFGELPAMSSVAMEVLEKSRSDSGTPEAIAKLVRQDPGLALKLMKLANSAAYSRGDPVDSLDRAILMIGTKAIGQAVLSIGVISSFSSLPEDAPLDIQSFWEHSIACGLFAAALARQMEDMDPDAAFTMGLMHDIGKLVLMSVLPADYFEALRASLELGARLDVVEQRFFLTDHGQAMDKLLRRWGFSREMIDPVVFHHEEPKEIRTKPKAIRDEIALLGLADRLAHACGMVSGPIDLIQPLREHRELLDVDPAVIDECIETIPDQVADLKMALLTRSSAALPPTCRDTMRERLAEAGGVRLLLPSEHTAYLEAFVKSIARDGSEDPDVVLVPLRGSAFVQQAVEAIAQLGADGAGRLRRAVILCDKPALSAQVTSQVGVACCTVPLVPPVGVLVDAMADREAEGKSVRAAA